MMILSRYIAAIIFAVGLWLTSDSALAEYAEPASFTNPTRVIRLGSPGYSTALPDDSAVFQKAIDEVAEAGGGRVIVPTGNYQLANVKLANDVHLVFDGPSTIHPHVEGVGRGTAIAVFAMGTESFTKNTSIRGINGWTRFVFDNHRELRAFVVADTRNFLLSNFNIEDTRTIFCAVEMTGRGQNADGSFKIPTGGTVQHIRNSNAHYGYGTIQAQSSKSVMFKDIESIGGVALRLETGWKTMNATQTGGVFDIHADDIAVHSGQAAVMLMPHSMHNGAFYGKNIHSTASEYALLVENGSLHKFNDKEIEKLGLTKGTFEFINVDGVDAVYSDGPIETRWVHLLHYPKELHAKIYHIPSGYDHRYRGPAIAAVSVPDLKAPNLKIAKVVARGFAHHPPQIDDSDQTM